MNNSYLDSIKKGQSETVAFIPSESEIEVLLETISALSNTKGGYIYIGVNNKGKIVGINPVGIKDEISKVVSTHFKSLISFNLDLCYENHKSFCVLKIPEAINKPLFYFKDLKKVSFFRNKTDNIKVFNILGQIWSAKKKMNNQYRNDYDRDELSKDELSILASTPKEEVITFSKLHSLVGISVTDFERSLVHLVLTGKIKYVLNKKNITFTREN